MSINNDSLNSGLRELSKSIEESRSLHDRNKIDHIFENRSPLILEAYIHQIMGTLEDFLPNLRDYPSIYLKKKVSRQRFIQKYISSNKNLVGKKISKILLNI